MTPTHPLQQFRQNFAAASKPFPPVPPPWRDFRRGAAVPALIPVPPLSDTDQRRATTYVPSASGEEFNVIKAAVTLRRPILLTGPPGVGKSTLAYVAAHFLGLGNVIRWEVTSQSSLEEGLYNYDAIARLQQANLIASMRQIGDPDLIQQANKLLKGDTLKDEGRFFSLGPLGTALLPTTVPRVLLIDEIDKSDIDLPGDLLHVLEEGAFTIPELARLPSGPEFDTIPVRLAKSKETYPIHRGEVKCYEFPLIFMTSNGERDFPRAFKRRCLRWSLKFPEERLRDIVREQMDGHIDAVGVTAAVNRFVAKTKSGTHSIDQLLNMYFLQSQAGFTLEGADQIAARNLDQSDSEDS